MSPNEFQLRSALRDGEGEHVNPDTVIARARGMQQARHDRRVRYASVAAAVAVVGGIGVVGGVALSGGGDTTSTANSRASTSAGDKAANGAQAARPGASSAQGNQPAAPGPMSRAAAISCPDSAPKLMVPGGGGTGQFGARGPLFSGPVESVKVCAYASATSSVAASTVLAGENATDLTKSMEDAAPTMSASIKCPGGATPTEGHGSLVIIGSDKNGNPMKPVVVTLGCPTRVTNGTALRFNWTPPANITNLINQGVKSTTGGPYSLPPPGKVTGSPIQS